MEKWKNGKVQSQNGKMGKWKNGKTQTQNGKTKKRKNKKTIILARRTVSSKFLLRINKKIKKRKNKNPSWADGDLKISSPKKLKNEKTKNEKTKTQAVLVGRISTDFLRIQ